MCPNSGCSVTLTSDFSLVFRFVQRGEKARKIIKKKQMIKLSSRINYWRIKVSIESGEYLGGRLDCAFALFSFRFSPPPQWPATSKLCSHPDVFRQQRQKTHQTFIEAIQTYSNNQVFGCPTFLMLSRFRSTSWVSGKEAFSKIHWNCIMMNRKSGEGRNFKEF